MLARAVAISVVMWLLSAAPADAELSVGLAGAAAATRVDYDSRPCLILSDTIVDGVWVSTECVMLDTKRNRKKLRRFFRSATSPRTRS